jgi:S-adenosyl-L-methionine hydrolase (adenosine-forming)
MKRAIVTFTTDFGLSDGYVAQMKGAVLKQAPAAVLVDVTHLIGAQDVLAGSVVLERAIAAFPRGTIHIAVVDPGVGTDRRILIVEINGQRVICPDNGLITWAWRMNLGAKAHALTWRPRESSATFHGRDIMAPVAGMLAKGKAVRSLAKRIGDPILLEVAASDRKGRIIYVDHFGNAITNIRLQGGGDCSVLVKKKSVGLLRQTYADVAKGETVALIGSSGLVEIAVRDGSAAEMLGLKVGDEVALLNS